MGLSGLVGAGAQAGLDDLLARQMAEQQMALRLKQLEAEERARAEQAEIQRRQLASLDQNRAFQQAVQVENIAQDQAAAQQAATREQALAGARQNADLVRQMPGLTDDQRESEILGVATRSGNPQLIEIAKLSRRPEDPEAKLARELRLHEGKAEIDARYRRGSGTAPGPRGLTPTAEASLVSRLANQWTVATKNAKSLDNSLVLMEAGMEAARRGDLAQGGQTVLVTFQKILDPTSVVRESEYSRSQEGQALLTRVQGAFDRLRSGGVGIPLPELEKYAQLAREARNAQVKALAGVRGRISNVANRYAIPEELVFDSNFGTDEPGADAPGAEPSAPTAPGAAQSSGSRYQEYLKRRGGG